MHRCPELVFIRALDGSIVTVSASEYQSALNAGYTNVSQSEAAAAAANFAKADPLEAIRLCLLTAPDDYSKSLAALETSWSSLIFSEPDDPKALARVYRFAEEHNGLAVWAEIAPWIPMVLLGAWLALSLAWRGFWKAVRAVVGEARSAWRG